MRAGWSCGGWLESRRVGSEVPVFEARAGRGHEKPSACVGRIKSLPVAVTDTETAVISSESLYSNLRLD